MQRETKGASWEAHGAYTRSSALAETRENAAGANLLMMSSDTGKKAQNAPGSVRHCMKIGGSWSMVHGKSSGLELSNVEERVFFATTVPLSSSVAKLRFSIFQTVRSVRSCG